MKRAFLVFFLGETSLVEADDARHAIELWRAIRIPDRGVFGRLAIGPDELRARPLKVEDEAWIVAQCDEPPSAADREFIRALAALKVKSAKVSA